MSLAMQFTRSIFYNANQKYYSKIKSFKVLKIKIRSAQNVGKVWISRKSPLPAGRIDGRHVLDFQIVRPKRYHLECLVKVTTNRTFHASTLPKLIGDLGVGS